MGGRRESEAGLRGCLESRAALTSLGAQFGWSALKKERASGDAAAHSSDRLQQQQRLRPATAATAARGAPEAGVATARCVVPTGAPTRQTPAWLQKPPGLQTPAELQKPVERLPARLGLHQPRRCPLQASGSQLPASGTMDTSRVRSMLLSLPALLQLVAAGSPPRPDTLPRGCPSHCQCDLDGRMLLRVDCSDLGLSELPSNLSVFTSYL